MGSLKNVLLTQARLMELLEYNPETGIFIWRSKNEYARLINVGDVAGHINSRGYCIIKVDGNAYKAHRLAWLYMTGEWPYDQIDHVNTIRNDNRWCNLRIATDSQNRANSPLRSNNTSGFKGVTYNKRIGLWLARITMNGKKQVLGVFSTPEAAHEAYKEAAKRVFGEFARFG